MQPSGVLLDSFFKAGYYLEDFDEQLVRRSGDPVVVAFALNAEVVGCHPVKVTFLQQSFLLDLEIISIQSKGFVCALSSDLLEEPVKTRWIWYDPPKPTSWMQAMGPRREGEYIFSNKNQHEIQLNEMLLSFQMQQTPATLTISFQLAFIIDFPRKPVSIPNIGYGNLHTGEAKLFSSIPLDGAIEIRTIELEGTQGMKLTEYRLPGIHLTVGDDGKVKASGRSHKHAPKYSTFWVLAFGDVLEYFVTGLEGYKTFQ